MSQASALRSRNFLLLWTGQSISLVGNGIFTVALPLEVLQVSNSSLSLAVVVSARLVPWVSLLLFGGTLVDRLSRRIVMLVCDVVSGLSVSALALVVVLHQARIWELVLLAVVFGSSNAFFMPAATAITPELLPRELLVSGNALNSLSQSLGQYLAGPLLGGIMVAIVGTGWAFGIDGASFLFSAFCLVAIKNVAAAETERSAVWKSIREGLSYCRSQPWLWWSMLAVGLANLVSFVPLSTFLQPLLVRHVFNAGSLVLGIMYAANGAGGAAAAIYVKRYGAPRHRVTAILTAWGSAGLAAILVGISPWPWMAIVFVACMWLGVTYGNVLWLPLMQEEVPPRLLGRVSSVDWLFSLALSPVGTIIAGILAGTIGIRMTIIIGGALSAATVGVLAVPGVRLPDQQNKSSAPQSNPMD